VARGGGTRARETCEGPFSGGLLFGVRIGMIFTSHGHTMLPVDFICVGMCYVKLSTPTVYTVQ
jgi:hypothetical protein